MAGVFVHFWGLPLTLPAIVMDGRKLGPSDVLGRTHYPLQCFAVGDKADAITNTQDALDVAAVEPFEDLRTHAVS